MSDDELFAHWQSVRNGVSSVQARLDQVVEESGVAAQWFVALRLLLQADGFRLPMNVLAREMSMTTGGFTKLADRMARDGLIDRRSSEQDRRVVNATLTADGQRAARRAAESYADQLRASLLSVVTPAELSAAAVTMRALGVRQEDTDVPVVFEDVPRTERGAAVPERRRQRPARG